jgi:hypothetical protein
MSSARTSATARRAVAAAAVGIGAFAAIPSAASAATTTNACDASAVQLSLLGSPAIEPLRANAAFTPCATDNKTLVDLPVLGLARVNALEASTKVTAGKEAVSNVRVAGVKLGADAALGDLLKSKLLSGPSSIVGQITHQVDGLLGPLGSGPLAGLLGSGSAGATPAAALPAGLGGIIGGLPIVGGAAGGLPVLGGLQLQGTNSSTLLSSITDALPAALAAAIPDILDVGVLRSTATAQCVSGAPKLSGSSSIADLKILGTSIDVNSAAGRALSLDTADLQLGKLLSVTDLLKGIKIGTTGLLGQLLAGSNGGSTETTLYDLLNSRDAGVVGLVNGLLGGQTLGSLTTALANTLQPLLDQIRIQLPPGLLRVTIDANRQTVTGDQLSQQVLAVGVQLLGQPVLAAGVGRARVSSGAAGCGPTAAPKAEPPKKDTPAPSPKKKYPSPVAKEVLKCTTRPAQLIDVYGTHGKTFVQGVAQKRFVGKTARIYLRHGGKRVGSAKVLKNGMFSTRVALPPSRIRYTNSARYFAIVSGRKTRALKFARRMATTSITAKGRRVTFKGRVLGPRQARQQPILIKQRVTCKTYRTIKRVMPDASGRFEVQMSAPSKLGAGIYRAQTHVIERSGTSKLFPTYTLPRPVGLN